MATRQSNRADKIAARKGISKEEAYGVMSQRRKDAQEMIFDTLGLNKEGEKFEDNLVGRKSGEHQKKFDEMAKGGGMDISMPTKDRSDMKSNAFGAWKDKKFGF